MDSKHIFQQHEVTAEDNKLQDINMKRSLVALNVKSRVRRTHTLLDVNNIFNRTMLRKMSNNVERIRRHLINNPFLTNQLIAITSK